ncbi:hypothetical protein Tsp_00099 [Trichinella spiralis]|uniref:hypothetical protein n=1 Tax=Trichinella spiralis TaxID=6334 RepID=UPI0001EFBE3B|nr:hypothetical protein Tsp_00099 [Trichinella spiralis]
MHITEKTQKLIFFENPICNIVVLGKNINIITKIIILTSSLPCRWRCIAHCRPLLGSIPFPRASRTLDSLVALLSHRADATCSLASHRSHCCLLPGRVSTAVKIGTTSTARFHETRRNR